MVFNSRPPFGLKPRQKPLPIISFISAKHFACGHMAIDSKVAFQNRALELGITQADLETLADSGINSYAAYAYCCTYQPGQNDDTALTNFLATTLGAPPSAAATTKFRRLFFEAHALSLEDLKSRAERTEASEARILPLQHRATPFAQCRSPVRNAALDRYRPNQSTNSQSIVQCCNPFASGMHVAWMFSVHRDSRSILAVAPASVACQIHS